MTTFLTPQHRSTLQQPIQQFEEELKLIRGSRATPMLVERISVEAYGGQTPLMQLASIHAPEPQTIVIEPWDKNIIKEIEKAIETSDLGLNPSADGQVIRISIPPLTEERRMELTKLLHRKAEEARVSVRGHREELLKRMKDREREGKISEDDFFRFEKELQQEIDQINEKIKQIAEKKEREILMV